MCVWGAYLIAICLFVIWCRRRACLGYRKPIAERGVRALRVQGYTAGLVGAALSYGVTDACGLNRGRTTRWSNQTAIAMPITKRSEKGQSKGLTGSSHDCWLKLPCAPNCGSSEIHTCHMHTYICLHGFVSRNMCRNKVSFVVVYQQSDAYRRNEGMCI